MERMIILCLLFFCSSTVLTAAPHRTLKYNQLLKTINRLETTVKDTDAELLHTPEHPVDECIFMALTCFQHGALKLQPLNSQVNSTFTQTMKTLKSFTFRNPRTCESSCESHEKKKPKVFLKSFANLVKKLIKYNQGLI